MSFCEVFGQNLLICHVFTEKNLYNAGKKLLLRKNTYFITFIANYAFLRCIRSIYSCIFTTSNKQLKSMKATVEYRSGLMLIIPKMTNAPLLLLEWVAKFPAGVNVIHKVIDNQESVLKFRLNVSGQEYDNCAEYINSNL